MERSRARSKCLDPLILLLVCLPTLTRANVFQGRVVAIADGDTITVLDAGNSQHRVRLQGIDAPERGQAFGTVSRQNLANLIFNRQVTVEYDKLDRYGRIVGKVLVDGRDICLEQIRAGLAWHYKQYENEQSPEDRRLYAEAEREARAARRELWRDESPTPPWDFRRSNGPQRGNSNTRPDSQQMADVVNSNTSMPSGPIIGNRRSRIYHWPGCPNYNDVSPQNRVIFQSREEAERAGYRAARNCPR